MAGTLGIIFSYSDHENLRELTKIRTIASLPLAGKYRIIDFILSNYVNSGIYDVSIITKSNYHSLIDHLGSGKEWDMTRKRGGLRVLTPFAGAGVSDSGIYRGTIDALASNMHSLKRSMADYVVLSGSSIIYGMDLQEIIKSHIEKNVDISCVYTKRMGGHGVVPMGAPIYYMDGEERIRTVEVNRNGETQQNVTWGIGVYVLRKSLLESLVADAMAYARYDFDVDITRRLAPTLNIRGFEYEGYLLDVGNVSDYMEANLRFLSKEVREQVFANPIYTKVKDSVPVFYGPGCEIKNSIISDGCTIEGTIENCIISRGVKIGKGSVVKNSIIMQNTEIMKNVSLSHVILDKDVIVRENKELAGHQTYPVVIEKLSIV